MKLVLDEAQCRKAGLPEHATEFRLGQTVDNIRHQGQFVQTEETSRKAQYTANKDWLEAHLDKTWLWTKLSWHCEFQLEGEQLEGEQHKWKTICINWCDQIIIQALCIDVEYIIMCAHWRGLEVDLVKELEKRSNLDNSYPFRSCHPLCSPQIKSLRALASHMIKFSPKTMYSS